MIINRRTFHAKPGRTEEAAAALKGAIESFPAYTGAYRIYTWGLLATPPENTVVVEFEYEDFEAYQRLWNEWAATPEAAKYAEETAELWENRSDNEIWELAASR